MWKWKLQPKIRTINRLRQILGVTVEVGGGILIKQIRLNYLVPLSCRIHCFFHPRHPKNCLIRMRGEERVISSRVLREMLERLGPTFVKFGQALSLRADLVGEELSEELSKLQSNVRPFAWEEAEPILIQELGKEPSHIFQSIEEQPIAAASLAQVHRAFLKDGSELAVKIQRPQIRNTIEQDIKILFYLAKLSERFLPELRPYQPVRVVKEFADWTMRELDFEAEGNNAERFRSEFKDNAHIHIPKIYWDYTTSKVLAMEFMHGVKANDLEGIKQLAVDPKQLALNGVEAFFQQFLINGFFHADPHPGNFFALKGNVLCLHDFGIVGYLTEEQRKELVSCFVAFVDKNIEGFLKHFMHLAILSADSDITGFHKDASNILSAFFFSTRQRSIARSFFKVINRSAFHHLRFPGDLVLFGKAVMMTESMGLKLYPGFDLNRELQPFIQKALNHYLEPKRIAQSFKTEIFDYLEFFRTLPEQTQKFLSRIEQGEMSIKVDPSELLDLKKEFDRQNNARILGVVLTAVLLVTGVLLHLEGIRSIVGFSLGKIGVVTSIVLFLWFIVVVIRKPK